MSLRSPTPSSSSSLLSSLSSTSTLVSTPLDDAEKWKPKRSSLLVEEYSAEDQAKLSMILTKAFQSPASDDDHASRFSPDGTHPPTALLSRSSLATSLKLDVSPSTLHASRRVSGAVRSPLALVSASATWSVLEMYDMLLSPQVASAISPIHQHPSAPASPEEEQEPMGKPPNTRSKSNQKLLSGGVPPLPPKLAPSIFVCPPSATEEQEPEPDPGRLLMPQNILREATQPRPDPSLLAARASPAPPRPPPGPARQKALPDQLPPSHLLASRLSMSTRASRSQRVEVIPPVPKLPSELLHQSSLRPSSGRPAPSQRRRKRSRAESMFMDVPPVPPLPPEFHNANANTHARSKSDPSPTAAAAFDRSSASIPLPPRRPPRPPSLNLEFKLFPNTAVRRSKSATVLPKAKAEAEPKVPRGRESPFPMQPLVKLLRTSSTRRDHAASEWI